MPQFNYLRACFIILLLWCGFFSAAQETVTRQYTSRQGLPVDDVFCAAQDDDGFMWFGTALGLAHFNGRNFTHYFRNEGLVNKAVTDICSAGGDSLLFISYPDALQSINSKTGRINTLAQNITAFKPSRITRDDNRFFIYQPGTGHFMVWANNKLHPKSIDSILKKQGVLLNAIVNIKEGKSYLACTTAGAFIISGSGVMPLVENENITGALLTGTEQLVLAGEQTIYSAELEQNSVTPLAQLPAGFRVNNMIKNAQGAILLGGTDKGLFMLESGRLTDISATYTIGKQTIRRLYADIDHNTWYCTNGGILLERKTAFTGPPVASSLYNNDVEQLLATPHGIFVGTANGLSLLQTNGTLQSITLPALPGTGQPVKILSRAGAGNILAAITGLQESTSLYREIKTAAGNLQLFNREFAAPAGNGDYWVFDEGSKMLLRYAGNDPQPADMFNLAFSGCRKVYAHIVYKGEPWFGTDRGIIRIRNSRADYIPSVLGKKLQQVFKFFVDAKNTLWLATDDGLLNYHDRSFNRVPIGEGYIANYCRDLLPDAKGNLWIATWDGIVYRDSNTTRRFNIGDGLISKTVNCLALDSAGNTLYAGTSNGLSMLRMNGLPGITLKKAFVHCYQRDSLRTPVPGNSILAPGKYSFTFSISVPEYGNAEEINFDYRMDEGEWKLLKDYTINIDDIRSGKHHFYVRVHSVDAASPMPVTEFVFTIRTPFYKKTWFIVLLVVLAQALVVALLSYINKRKRKQAIRKHQQLFELAALRQKAFTTLINPHFIFNALNSIQTYINRQDRQAANRYLSDFASLIRKNFDAAQQAFIPLEEELESDRLYLQLEQMRFPGKFDYELSVSEKTDPEELMIPSMIIQPFLENAILHGLSHRTEKGRLLINIDHRQDALHIQITDNGIGMEKSRAARAAGTHRSHGMQLIKDKLNVLSRFGDRPVSLEIKEANPGAEYPGVHISIIIPDSVYESFPGEEAINR